MIHGGPYAYERKKCRCELCVQAHRIRRRRHNRKFSSNLLARDPAKWAENLIAYLESRDRGRAEGDRELAWIRYDPRIHHLLLPIGREAGAIELRPFNWSTNIGPGGKKSTRRCPGCSDCAPGAGARLAMFEDRVRANRRALRRAREQALERAAARKQQNSGSQNILSTHKNNGTIRDVWRFVK